MLDEAIGADGGSFDKAFALLREAVEVRTTVLGADHPSTRMSADALAAMERAVDPEHAAALVVGAAVTSIDGDEQAPAGTVGEIVAV